MAVHGLMRQVPDRGLTRQSTLWPRRYRTLTGHERVMTGHERVMTGHERDMNVSRLVGSEAWSLLLAA